MTVKPIPILKTLYISLVSILACCCSQLNTFGVGNACVSMLALNLLVTHVEYSHKTTTSDMIHSFNLNSFFRARIGFTYSVGARNVSKYVRPSKSSFKSIPDSLINLRTKL